MGELASGSSARPDSGRSPVPLAIRGGLAAGSLLSEAGGCDDGSAVTEVGRLVSFGPVTDSRPASKKAGSTTLGRTTTSPTEQAMAASAQAKPVAPPEGSRASRRLIGASHGSVGTSRRMSSLRYATRAIANATAQITAASSIRLAIQTVSSVSIELLKPQ
jgi:hypothetical protein